MTAVGVRAARPRQSARPISDHEPGPMRGQAALEPEDGAAGAVGVARPARPSGAVEAVEHLAAPSGRP